MRSHSRSRSCSRLRYSAVSLVIESECKRTGTDVDAEVDTLLYIDTGVLINNLLPHKMGIVSENQDDRPSLSEMLVHYFT